MTNQFHLCWCEFQEKYRNAFMGYGPEDTNFCLELTENYDKNDYDLGTGFGHFALALPDVYKTCESIKKAGEHSHDFALCVCVLLMSATYILLLQFCCRLFTSRSRAAQNSLKLCLAPWVKRLVAPLLCGECRD